MGIIFDLSLLLRLEKTGPEIARVIKGREGEPFGISVVTVAELLHAVERAPSDASQRLRQAWVERIIDHIPLYPFDAEAARVYARIWSQLIHQGVAAGAHDLMVAATCISLGFTLLTSEVRDYGKVEGLRLEEFVA